MNWNANPFVRVKTIAAKGQCPDFQSILKFRTHILVAIHIADKLGLLSNQILFVGDSTVVMKTATATGMFPVGALWGFKTVEELKLSGVKALIEHPKEILYLMV